MKGRPETTPSPGEIAALELKVDDLRRFVQEGFAEIRKELATAHKEHQDIGKCVIGASRSLGRKLDAVSGWFKTWLGIIAKTFREKRIPRNLVSAAANDRYGSVNWSLYKKYPQAATQIKAVIDFTHDNQPITEKVSEKYYKKTSGGHGKNLKEICRCVWADHKADWEDWAKSGLGYPSVNDLYHACYGILNRVSGKRKNPFRMSG